MNQERRDRGQRATSAARASTLLMRNTLWNVLGAGLPLLVTLLTLPVLIRGIGTERFGVLMIAWVILGYFGLFDLGLGRATTKFLAEDFEHGRMVEAKSLFWTSTILNLFLGLIGGLTLAILAAPLVEGVLKIPTSLQPESLKAFYLMAGSMPLVTITPTVRGVLEAQHRFGLLNAIQVPASALSQFAPLLVLPFSANLAFLVGALVLSRLVGMIVFLGAALRQLERPLTGPFFMRERLGKLLSYGSWLTVTNVIGPLMVYADRFVIGSLASMSAVTYYATPYEAVTRLWILPHSLMRTVFPIFSAVKEIRQRSEVYVYSVKHLALVLALVVATVIVFAPDVMRLWLGETFAENSTLVLQILAVGIFVNSLALVPFNLIQGLGRTDVTAKFHLLELPFYLLALWLGVRYLGIAGAALAWTARVTVDGLLLVAYVRLTGSLIRLPGRKLMQSLSSSLSLIFGGWLLDGFVHNLVLKTAIWGLLLIMAGYGIWRTSLTPDEQSKLIVFGRRLAALTVGGGANSRGRKADR